MKVIDRFIKNHSRAFLALLGFAATVCVASADVIPANRRIDWSKAGVGAGAGIPNRTTIFATFTPANTAADINNAILGCPTNQVIYLSAGDYYLNSVIVWQGGGLHGNFITLRGAGPDKTFLHFTNSTYSGDGYFWLRGSDAYNEQGQGYLVASGLQKGSTNMTLFSPITDMPPVQPGDVFWLDQVYNTNNITPIGWGEATPAHAMLGRGSDPAGYRVQVQAFNVYSYSGTNISFTTPVYMTNWDTTHQAQLFRGALHGGGARGIGFENFTVIANTNDNMGAEFAFEWANDCWVKNVTSMYGGVYQHVSLGLTKNCTVQDCYFYGSRSSGSDAYGIEIGESSDFLYQNNILNGVTTPIFVDCGSSGCVISYNYITNIAYNGGQGWFSSGIGGSHGAHPTMNLYEGNVAIGFVFDNVHGSSSDQTVFRNYVAGWVPGASVESYPIIIQAHGERMNIVGNVLGTDGYHNNLDDTILNILNNPKSIYMLGYWGNWAVPNGTPYTYSIYANDTGVVSSIYRHGNYDYATHSVIWDASNPDHTLPTSLYISGTPSWWPTNAAFPPIGSDLSPMVVSIPAQLRFLGLTNIGTTNVVVTPPPTGTGTNTNTGGSSTNGPGTNTTVLPAPTNLHIVK